jgi:hypothetical protein
VILGKININCISLFVIGRCLQMDRDEVEALRQARQLEEEKAQYSVIGCQLL